MKNFLKGIWGLVEVLIIIYVIAITACLLATNKYGFTQFGDTTLVTIDEFRSAYLEEAQEKDLLIVRGTPSKIEVGDKIYYYGTADNKYTVETAQVKEIINEDQTAAVYQLDDEDEIDFKNGYVFKVISTPFHTNGSVCFLSEKENALFTGDTLFKGSIGRTDLPKGNERLISSSLKKLLKLDDNLKIYPGHGDETTLKKEKENNIYLLKIERE